MSGTCARCGRPLSVLESVVRGIGPICWTHMVEAAEAEAAKPENINWPHLQTLVGRIQNDFRRGGRSVNIPAEVLASLHDLVRIADQETHTDQDRALVSANAWTIAYDTPLEALADNDFLVHHTRNLLDLVVMNDEAAEIEKMFMRRKQQADKLAAAIFQRELAFA